MSVMIVKDSTNVSVTIRIIDSTDGTPETGVVWNTAGIDLEYRREGAVSTDITEATLAALTTAHTDGGFLHIGNGYYRLDVPDAAFATGVDGVLIHGTVTGMVVIGEYIQLTDFDMMSTSNAVGVAASVTGAVGSVTGAVGSVTGSVGSVTGAVGSVTAEVTADVTKISGDATAADNCELFFDGTGYAGTNNVIPTVTTVGTTTTNTDMLTAAAVNAEVVDVLKTDTIADLSAATPPSTPTFKEAVMYLYSALRNKTTVTATLKQFFNNGGTAIWDKTLSDDTTTYTEAEGVVP